MKRLLFILLLLLTLQNGAFAFTRFFYLDEELKNASLIKEIIIVGYTSRIDTLTQQQPVGIEKVIDEMSYTFPGKPDSVFKYRPRYTGYVNATAYYHIKTKENFSPLVPEGYWPAIGDTVLVVFNNKKEISLFAEITSSNEYKFWSPYHTSSWNTIFFARAPFKAVKPLKYSKKILEGLQQKAIGCGYEFASPYHCLINRKDLWPYLQKLKKQ